MKDLFVFGTSGHALEVSDTAAALGWRPVFVARDAQECVGWSRADDVALEADVAKLPSPDCAMGVGDNQARARIAAAHQDARWPSIIHPDTSFGRGQYEVANGARGTVIFAGVRLSSHIAIGQFCVLNLNVTISHDCEIGDFVNLSPGANVAGNVRVEGGAWIGVGVAVNQGTPTRKLTIGSRTVVGSGAVVVADCEADSVYVGVPARKIRWQP